MCEICFGGGSGLTHSHQAVIRQQPRPFRLISLGIDTAHIDKYQWLFLSLFPRQLRDCFDAFECVVARDLARLFPPG